MWEELYDIFDTPYYTCDASGKEEDHNEHAIDFEVHDKSEFSTNTGFSSREELINWVQTNGRSLGYVIVIKRSNNGPNGVINKIFFQCDRGGIYKGDKPSIRNTGTKRINCPFGLVGKYSNSRGCWELRVQCETHNHDPALHMEGHPYATRLSASEAPLVDDLSANGVKPRAILATLKKQNPNNVSTMKTIYNERNKTRMRDNAGRTQMQILMSFLVKENYFYQTRVNSLTNELEDLFFAHSISLDLWRAFPHVVLMDATYKTNRYNMPLLEIVGVTSTNITFCIAFVFMSNENESTYTWALDCLRSTMNGCICPRVIVTDRELSLIKASSKVFPNAKILLCRWHISQSVMKRSKKKISKYYSQDSFFQAWNRLVQSISEEEYFNNLQELQTILTDHLGVLKYLNDTWLNPYKDMFVSAWIDKYLHYGNTTNNRAESQHSRLKLFLDAPNSNLQSSLSNIHGMIKAQEIEIRASFEQSKIVRTHRYNMKKFSELCGFVSKHALDLIYNELQRCDDVGIFSENCGCRLRTSHGLPCAHEQALYYSQNWQIPIDSIDMFWRKLDFAPCMALNDDDIGCEDEVQMFTDTFKRQSRTNKFSLLRKLKEIVVPSTISMREPVVQKSTRRRPSLKDKFLKSFHVDQSLAEPPRRSYYDMSHFNDIDFSGYQTPARHSCCVSAYQRIEFIDQFEPILQPYIKQVQNVKSDGNCGFRAIALCLGFDEDAWPKIRRDLLAELREHKSEYDNMFNPEHSAQLEASLSWFYEGEGILAPEDHWMSMPNMGVLIASRYDQILNVLSNKGSCTYLPLRSKPKHWTQHSPIVIGFVNGNHFVKVTLAEGYPMPTIYLQWFDCRHPRAAGWATPYQARIKRYIDYIKSKCTVEYATIDD